MFKTGLRCLAKYFTSLNFPVGEKNKDTEQATAP